MAKDHKKLTGHGSPSRIHPSVFTESRTAFGNTVYLWVQVQCRSTDILVFHSWYHSLKRVFREIHPDLAFS